MSESIQQQVPSFCPRCGVSDALRIEQRVHRGSLRWSETVACQACGLRREADGVGIPPDNIRARLIEVEGLWVVRLSHVNSPARTLKIMREALSLDMKGAADIAKNIPGVIYTGTREEVNWISGLLRESGEKPEMIRN